MLLALPLILANITTPILGLVDTAILGRMDDLHYFAGAAIGSLVVTQLYWVCGFLKMSITGLSAQNKHSEKGRLKVLVQGICLAFGLALLILIFQNYVLNAGLYFAQVNTDVASSSHDYFSVRIWGAPAALINLVLIGWLVGQQQTKWVLWLQLIVNVTNIVASLLLVYVFDLGVKGVAAATVLAEYLMLACALFYIFFASAGQSNFILLQSHINKNLNAGQTKLKQFTHIVSLQNMRALLSLNGNMFVRNIVLQLTLAFVTLKGAQFGETAVAVNAILLQFFTLIALGLDGIANAVEALVGEEKGKVSAKGVHSHVKTGLIFSSTVAVLYSLLFVFLDSLIINLLTHHQAVILALAPYKVIIVMLPIVAHWCFLFDGVFVGLSKGKAMRDSMLLSAVFGFIPIWLMFSAYGNIALWAAMFGFLLGRGLFQGGYYWYWSRVSHRLLA